MTFLEAYAIAGPDVERIAYLLGIPQHAADRLINELLDRRYQKRVENCRRPA